MYTGFGFIRQIEDQSDGLQVTFANALLGHLKDDHPELCAIRELLYHYFRESQTRPAPRPIWIALDDNRAITEVRSVGRCGPLNLCPDDEGGYWIPYPFSGNVDLHLKADHPRFVEFEHFFREALRNMTYLFFVTAPGSIDVIDDMMPVA